MVRNKIKFTNNLIFLIIVLTAIVVACVVKPFSKADEDNVLPQEKIEINFISKTLDIENTKSAIEIIDNTKIKLPEKIDDNTVEMYYYKGMEYEPGKYIELNDEELESIEVMYAIDEIDDSSEILMLANLDESYSVPGVKKYVFVNNLEQTINGVKYLKGKNTNNGLTPNTAVETLAKAYSMLDENNKREEQYIIIIGSHSESYISYNELSTKVTQNNVFTKPATITGKYNDVDYNGKFYFVTGTSISVDAMNNFLLADTTFEYLTLASKDSGSVHLQCQGRNLTMGEGLVMKDFTTKSAVDTSTGIIAGNRPDFHIIAGWLAYNSTNAKQKDGITNIVIKSGAYARLIMANRMGVAKAAEQIGFTPEKPFNVKLTLDIKEHDSRFAYDVNVLYGGNGEGAIYMNSEIDLKSGTIGRYTGGSRGNDVKDTNTIPGNTFFGSTVLNMSGGKISEFYAASLGSSREIGTSGYNGYGGNYQYGKIDVNISGGIIDCNLYGGAGGAVTGYSDNISDKYKNMAKGQTMKDMYGNVMPLDDMKLNLNISGGTFNGNIYAGGYGYSDRLQPAQLSTDAGYFYGDAIINISSGTINGNIYGGGRGYPSYGDTRPNLATFVGNTEINISGNAKVNGNIYGGGEGVNTYPEMAKVIGDVKINITGGTISNDIYGGGNAGSIVGDIDLALKNTTVSGNIYGGGNIGKINGKVNIEIRQTSVKGNVFGGGNAGDVYGDVTLKVFDKTNVVNTIYGGGNQANVGTIEQNANIYLTVYDADIGQISGSTITGGNVFGGGNNGVVYGNTIAELGSTDETIKTNVGDQFYAGGKGTAGMITVTGNSNGTIKGIYTEVKKYGDTSLGAVAGEVNITFDTYRRKNSINKYKDMTGINKATNMHLIESYVYLTGGLKDIGNLFMPSGTGMMISENSQISGNFTGGGELYLQNEVCLTVNGDLTAESTITKLTLNPALFSNEGYYKIEGGENNPYVRIVGNDNLSETAVVSGNIRKYEIAHKDTSNNNSIYYIDTTIIIPSYVILNNYNIEDSVYTKEITNEDNVNILNNYVFTSLMDSVYTMVKDNSQGEWEFLNPNELLNVRRYIYLSGSEEATSFPVGTRITMIENDNFYTYVVPENFGTEEYWRQVSELYGYTLNLGNELPLCMFEDNQGNNYVETTNIKDALENDPLIPAIWEKDEKYRFIIDFSECEEPIKSGEYSIYFDIVDLKADGPDYVFIDTKRSNVIKIESRDYNSTLGILGTAYSSKDVIKVNGNFSVSGISAYTTTDIGKDIILRLSLKNSNGGAINLPSGTIVKINDVEYSTTNMDVIYNVIENLSRNDYSNDIAIEIDMSKVQDGNLLETGKYYVCIDYYQSKDDVVLGSKAIESHSFEIDISQTIIHGIKVTPQANEGEKQDQAQLIIKDGSVNKKVKIEYLQGTLEDGAYIIAKSYKKASLNNFEYILLDSTFAELDNIRNLSSNMISNLVFDSSIENGTYRIVYELYNKGGTKVGEDFVNYIVYR